MLTHAEYVTQAQALKPQYPSLTAGDIYHALTMRDSKSQETPEGVREWRRSYEILTSSLNGAAARNEYAAIVGPIDWGRDALSDSTRRPRNPDVFTPVYDGETP